jgi:hypothetical protein
MVKCSDCKQEMLSEKNKSCLFPYVKINKKWYKRNTSYFDTSYLSLKEREKEEKEFGELRCHDCYIENRLGNVHHFGCDTEKCPKCKDQFAFCSCKKEAFADKEGMEKDKKKKNGK